MSVCVCSYQRDYVCVANFNTNCLTFDDWVILTFEKCI